MEMQELELLNPVMPVTIASYRQCILQFNQFLTKEGCHFICPAHQIHWLLLSSKIMGERTLFTPSTTYITLFKLSKTILASILTLQLSNLSQLF